MVYVDTLRKWGMVGNVGPYWSHMFADTLTELHVMADRIGLKRSWFQEKGHFPHYDIVPSKRKLAVLNGAKELEDLEFIKISSLITAKYAPCEGIQKAARNGMAAWLVKAHTVQCNSCLMASGKKLTDFQSLEELGNERVNHLTR